MDASVPDGGAQGHLMKVQLGHQGVLRPDRMFSSQTGGSWEWACIMVPAALALAENPSFQANAPMIWAQPPINYTPCGWGSVR